ncbi:MAG: hypothetical protein K2V38_28230, partial [Gemmataceae bacterium]|nr:hypothetical protein [Gemmataceae bacterium]
EAGTDAQGRKVYETKWVALPKRPADVKDPLGLTYYRRLSITEQVARATPGLLGTSNAAERREMRVRRELAAFQIPPHPTEEEFTQYRLPQPEVARFVIPSYAAHVILDHTTPEAAGKTTVLVYRVEHRTLSIEEFVNPRNLPGVVSSPYHPTTYRPYFLGEFGFVRDRDRPDAPPRIELLEPREPMLYWLVPILPRPGGVPPGEGGNRDFIDFMSVHALLNVIHTDEYDERNERVPFGAKHVNDPKYRDRVFDWDQLR